VCRSPVCGRHNRYAAFLVKQVDDGVRSAVAAARRFECRFHRWEGRPGHDGQYNDKHTAVPRISLLGGRA
jgi:hypothetical protein